MYRELCITYTQTVLWTDSFPWLLQCKVTHFPIHWALNHSFCTVGCTPSAVEEGFLWYATQSDSIISLVCSKPFILSMYYELCTSCFGFWYMYVFSLIDESMLSIVSMLWWLATGGWAVGLVGLLANPSIPYWFWMTYKYSVCVCVCVCVHVCVCVVLTTS